MTPRDINTGWLTVTGTARTYLQITDTGLLPQMAEMWVMAIVRRGIGRW